MEGGGWAGEGTSQEWVLVPPTCPAGAVSRGAHTRQSPLGGPMVSRQRVERGTSPGQTYGGVSRASPSWAPAELRTASVHCRLGPQSRAPPTRAGGSAEPLRSPSAPPASPGYCMAPWSGPGWRPHRAALVLALSLPLKWGPLHPVSGVLVDELTEGRTWETGVGCVGMTWGTGLGRWVEGAPSAQPDVLPGHPGHRAGAGAEVGARRRG